MVNIIKWWQVTIDGTWYWYTLHKIIILSINMNQNYTRNYFNRGSDTHGRRSIQVPFDILMNTHKVMYWSRGGKVCRECRVSHGSRGTHAGSWLKYDIREWLKRDHFPSVRDCVWRSLFLLWVDVNRESLFVSSPGPLTVAHGVFLVGIMLHRVHWLILKMFRNPTPQNVQTSGQFTHLTLTSGLFFNYMRYLI